jgi:site-specific DNA-methyltransferase (adenine-specific)
MSSANPPAKNADVDLDLAFTTSRGILFSDDCLRVMAHVDSDSIDTVFADPPFNIGKDYKNGYDDSRSESDYLEWSQAWLRQAVRILKPGGALFVYATPELAIRFGAVLNELATFRHWIALSMKGTYSRGKKLYPAHYALLYYTKGEPRVFNRVRIPVPTCRHCGNELKDYGGHRDKLNPAGLNLTDFWEDTSPNRHKKFKVRPGVNELKLMIPERAILISSNENDVVFDPFGGGGSTFQAAEKHSRLWLGSELYDSAHIESRMIEEFPFSINQGPPHDLWGILTNDEDYATTLL